MRTTIKAALAAVLLTGAGTQALAQDHDHRDQGGQARAPQAQARAPQAQAQRAPAPAGQPQMRNGGPRGGEMVRQGAPANPGFRGERGPAQNFQRPEMQRREGRGGPEARGERFQGQAPVNGAPAVQRFDRGAGQAPGQARQWDHERGPHEVIPPGVAGRGPDARHDGRGAGPGFDGRNGRDGAWQGGRNEGREGRRGGDRGGSERWQSGRYPPVYWSQHRFRLGGYRQPYGYYARAWAFGDFLPRGWFGQDYWLGDFVDYGLPYPPPGFEWVRVGDDAIMVDQYTGRVVQVVRGIFW